MASITNHFKTVHKYIYIPVDQILVSYTI